MTAVIIKICGLTREQDVKAAVSSGADAIGFVFTASPRRISADTARRLSSDIPAGVLRVGLLLNQHRSEIDQVINSVTLDVLQFHGNESEQDCDVYGLPWLKAVAMENAESASQAERDYPSAMGLLFDSHSAGNRGGSGKLFDWSLSAPLSKPVWLAGGLNPDNVAEAIRAVRPYAVDVSSGVESAPGIKDADRISKFINAVRVSESDSENEN
ncbi:MAG: phosphoribosylanthranilate isomerase [Xanthomonadales bacterium]|nr:phosphoribosylanthranilate isomerase [Xanthomonadales bacterium]